jgi:predicted transcriptional regulator
MEPVSVVLRCPHCNSNSLVTGGEGERLADAAALACPACGATPRSWIEVKDSAAAEDRIQRSSDAKPDSAVAKPLGHTEEQVLRAVWTKGTATVREVLQDGTIARPYSTVLTTMDRLFQKGHLGRTKDGKAFRYWALYSPDELQRRAVVSAIRKFLRSGHAAENLSNLVELIGEQDMALLDELQALVERKRAEMPPKKGNEPEPGVG